MNLESFLLPKIACKRCEGKGRRTDCTWVDHSGGICFACYGTLNGNYAKNQETRKSFRATRDNIEHSVGAVQQVYKQAKSDPESLARLSFGWRLEELKKVVALKNKRGYLYDEEFEARLASFLERAEAAKKSFS